MHQQKVPPFVVSDPANSEHSPMNSLPVFTAALLTALVLPLQADDKQKPKPQPAAEKTPPGEPKPTEEKPAAEGKMRRCPPILATVLFAGAALAQHRDKFTALHREPDIFNRGNAIERLAGAAHFEQ